MAVEQIDLALIDDNPYQPRLSYHRKDIDELAHSIKTHGLLQVPPGRRVDGRVELAFGHVRKRAFAKLAKKEPEKWHQMPVDIRGLTDDQMALFALEENLKRRDITPLETARAVHKYLTSFPSKTEVEVAGSLNMAQPTVANMRRVLRLPEKFLEKIDQGGLSFTQGKELLIFEKMANAEEMMKAALGGLRSHGGYGHANTVEGLLVSIHEVASRHFRPLDKKWQGYRWDLLFDTRAAGCLKCDKIIRTHPTKSETARYCLDDSCWDRHQAEHREKAAAEAKATMEAEIIKRAAESVTAEAKQSIPQGIPAEAPAEAATKLKQRSVPLVTDGSGTVLPVPCGSCANAETCDRSYFHVGDADSDRLVCEKQVDVAAGPEEVKAPSPEVPEDILALAREKAGTRAEVLDLNDICTGVSYWRQVKQGYAILDDELDHVDDPGECLERCTHGFHYTFDSKASQQKANRICSDTKCLGRKKSAFTRAKNADGQSRKRAETRAIKEAIAQTTTLDRPRIKLILLAQMDGQHTGRHYYGGTDGKRPAQWLWDKVSAGTPEHDRTGAKLFKAIDKLSDEQLAQLVVEFMFYYLTDKGDIGSYQVKADEPLKWMGVTMQLGG